MSHGSLEWKWIGVSPQRWGRRSKLTLNSLPPPLPASSQYTWRPLHLFAFPQKLQPQGCQRKLMETATLPPTFRPLKSFDWNMITALISESLSLFRVAAQIAIVWGPVDRSRSHRALRSHTACLLGHMGFLHEHHITPLMSFAHLHPLPSTHRYDFTLQTLYEGLRKMTLLY